MTQEDKRLNSKAASILRIYCCLVFVINLILIRYYHFQLFEISNSFKASISYIYEAAMHSGDIT